MSRNHDSLLLSVFQTAAFYSAMEKVKQAQRKFREILRTNPQAKFPRLSNIDSDFECNICAEILVNTVSLCKNGHDICGVCYDRIKSANSCPDCRAPLKPRLNRSLEEVIKKQYPEEYTKRFRQVTRENPITWRNDPAFNGESIQYK